MQTVTVVTREKEPVVQNKDWESPASLPNVLKCDLRAAAKDKGLPTALEKNCQFQLSCLLTCSYGRRAGVLESLLDAYRGVKNCPRALLLRAQLLLA